MNYKVVGEQFGDGPWVPVSQMKQKAVSGDSCQHSSPVTPASAKPDGSFTASVIVSQLASGDDVSEENTISVQCDTDVQSTKYSSTSHNNERYGG